ncbi:hypothetical protein Fcan01_22671 [Folsomia candida]|uniref:Uncharacterized protein n=1 Tax=Folsomia candida TaxID=158441 RepID=A0A226DC17_FOLCA|nr:hypothetical protein Fcan01_22671 [Folsomia candida]
MTFFLVLLIANCFGLLHLLRVPSEVVWVLNCSNDSEIKHREKGFHGFVPPYFIGIGLLAVITITAAPVTLLITSFIKPCMPPAFFTMATLPCKDWNHTTGNLLIRSVQGLVAAYTGLLFFSIPVFGLFVLFLYPVGVQLLLLQGNLKYCHLSISFGMALIDR